jgi:hypothetical protein
LSGVTTVAKSLLCSKSLNERCGLISTISWMLTFLAKLGGDVATATFRQQFIACLHLTERLGPRVFVWDLSVKAQGSVSQSRSETWITPYFSVGNPVIERSTEL